MMNFQPNVRAGTTMIPAIVATNHFFTLYPARMGYNFGMTLEEKYPHCFVQEGRFSRTIWFDILLGLLLTACGVPIVAGIIIVLFISLLL